VGGALRQGARPAGRRRGGLAGRLSGARALRLLALLLALLFFRPGVAQPAPAYDTLRAGTLRILHAPGHTPLAREALAAATRPIPLPGLGRGAAPAGTTIVLAPSPEAFSEAAGGRVPEWAGGLAIPSRLLIVMPAYPVPGVDRRSAQATLRHEIVHLVLHETFPSPLPRWFDEGYSEVASGTLRLALLLGEAPPLDSLEMAWPAREGRARMAYLLSATMVDHIRRRTGEEGFALLLENWRRLGSLDRAVRVTFGMTMGQLEDEWRAAVRSRYGWVTLAANVGAVWFAAMLLGFLALIPRRRRNRARMAAMEAEGRMLAPPRDDGVEVEYPLQESPDEHWPRA
jgi:hypothetical protein